MNRIATKVVAIVVALMVVRWITRSFFVEGSKIVSAIMFPTLKANDDVFVRKDAYGLRERRLPERGDVIVFRSPDVLKSDGVSRVIGLPGDTIRIEGGAVFVNDFRMATCVAGPATMKVKDEERSIIVVVELVGDRSYIVAHDQEALHKRESAHHGESEHEHRHGAGIEGPFTVRANEVFVLGDNRENSEDSRSWGDGSGVGVRVDQIKGRATTIWSSRDDAGARLSWTSLTDTPRCPVSFPPETCAAAERCLSNRPTRETATPPTAATASLLPAPTTPPAPTSPPAP